MPETDLVGYVCLTCLMFHPHVKLPDGRMDLHGIALDVPYSILFKIECPNCRVTGPQ